MAIDALVAALDDADSDVRENAAIALGHEGDLRAADALANCLADDEPGVRVCAAVALSRLGWTPQSPQDESLFALAIAELGHAASTGETVLQPLLEELTQAIANRIHEDSEPEIDQDSELDETGGNDTFADQGEAPASTPVEAPTDLDAELPVSLPPHPFSITASAPAAPESLAEPGVSAAPEAPASTPEPSDEIEEDLPPFAPEVSSAAPVEAAPAPGEPAPGIAELLQTAEGGTLGKRVAAIHALGTENGEEVTATLLNCLNDSEPPVRLAAAQVLDKRGDPTHAPCFLSALADDDFEVRLVAIQFIRRLNDPQVADLLCPLLSDNNVCVRRAAAQALGAARNRAAIQDLVIALVDEEPGVRVAATTALEEIDRKWAASPEAQQARARLQELLTHSRPGIGTAAVQLLEHLGRQAPAVSASSA